jgi:hypothetical protein
MKFTFEKNPVTGNPTAQFQAKLVSELSENVLQNSNKKNYRICTVEFENSKGEIQRASASIYEGNYSKGVTVGKTYLTQVTIVNGQAYLQMSHLENAARATADAFGFEVEATVPGVLAAQ